MISIARKRVGTKAVLKIPKPHALKKARLKRLATSSDQTMVSSSQIYRSKHAVKAAKKALAKRMAERFAFAAAPKPKPKRPRKTDASKLALKMIKMRRNQLIKRAGKGVAVPATA